MTPPSSGRSSSSHVTTPTIRSCLRWRQQKTISNGFECQQTICCCFWNLAISLVDSRGSRTMLSEANEKGWRSNESNGHTSAADCCRWESVSLDINDNRDASSWLIGKTLNMHPMSEPHARKSRCAHFPGIHNELSIVGLDLAPEIYLNQHRTQSRPHFVL